MPVLREITPKGESPYRIRTLWLTLVAEYVTQLPENCKKARSKRLAHSLPKEQHGGSRMKKGLISIVCLIVLMVSAIPAGAQTRYRRYDGRRYEQRYDGRRYRDWNRDRSVWDRHRDKLTTAAGAGAGALIGAMVGGKKGAIIGAIAGGGGAALYTYKLRDKNRDRWRNRRY
jgi:hypothetical protein